MSKQANAKVIGGFVLGAMALLVAGVLVFSSAKFFKNTKKFVLFFEGSVKGLNVGAPVDFRGVKVGSVTDIKVQLNEKDLSLHIPVIVEIEPNRIKEVPSENESGAALNPSRAASLVDMLVKRGLRAQLGMQSLVTGQLYVLLDFFPDKPVRLVGAEPGFPELPTVPSSLEQLTKTFEKIPLEELASKLVSAIEGIENFINSPDLKEILISLKRAVNDLEEMMAKLNDQVGPLTQDASKTLAGARKLLASIDREVKPLGESARQMLNETRGLARHVDEQVGPVANGIGDTLKQLDKTLASVDTVVGDDSELRYDLRNTLRELTAAARSLRALTDYLDRHPESLLRGKKQP